MILSTQSTKSRLSNDAVVESLSLANERYREGQTFLTRMAGHIADVQHYLQIHNASRSLENQNNLIASTQRLNALLESGVAK